MRQTGIVPGEALGDPGREGVGSLSGWPAVALLFLGSLLLYCVNLDQPVENPDEFYHILAARGLLETGEPRIADGFYWRSYLFTRLVAASFRLLGDGLVAARLPSVIATSVLVVVLFLWVRREAGAGAAWLAAGLYAISPFAVEVAQFCRFYALQALAMVGTAWLVLELVGRPARPRVQAARLVGAGGLAAVAVGLQPTSFMGLAGLAAWAVPALALRLLGRADLPWRARLGWLAAGVLLAVAALAVALASGRLAGLWELYREVPLFNVPLREQFWFYYLWYLLLYPTLWTPIGVLAVVAIVRSPGLGSLAAVTFAVAFLLGSFAGSKALRYLAFAQPFLFVLWGLALAALLPALAGWAGRLARELERRLAGLGSRARLAGRALIAAGLGVLLLANPFWLRTASLLADLPLGPELPDSDWERAAPILRPLLAEAAVLVNTEELGPLYYLGRHDILYSPSKLAELPPAIRADLGRDPRTGRPVIGSLEALERVIRCYPSGLFLAPALHWRRPYLADPEAADLLERLAEPVELPAGSHVHAYRWRHEGIGPGEAEACRGLPGLPGLAAP
jgi:hypothetical protein